MRPLILLRHLDKQVKRPRLVSNLLIIGVDTEAVIKTLDAIPVSIHCWQGDDVRGFEGGDELTGGIHSTGNYPGRARTADELRIHLEKALSQIPGAAKVNLHAIYGDANGVERDAIEPRHFDSWVDWGRDRAWGWTSIRHCSPQKNRSTG